LDLLLSDLETFKMPWIGSYPRHFFTCSSKKPGNTLVRIYIHENSFVNALGKICCLLLNKFLYLPFLFIKVIIPLSFLITTIPPVESFPYLRKEIFICETSLTNAAQSEIILSSTSRGMDRCS